MSRIANPAFVARTWIGGETRVLDRWRSQDNGLKTFAVLNGLFGQIDAINFEAQINFMFMNWKDLK